MRIGDDNEPAKEDDMVKMPAEIVIPWEGEISIKKLIQHTFPQLENHGWDASYMVERSRLTPKNCDVHMLNDMIINNFPGDEHILLSFDEVEGDTHNLYQQEYLHTIAPGHNTGKRAFLPRIKLKTTDGAGLPFMLIRKQFPIKLSFAITINKSQGQTISNVGIYLPRHVFSHGQFDAIDKPFMSYDFDEASNDVKVEDIINISVEVEVAADMPDTVEVEDGIASTSQRPQRTILHPIRLQD
ncbi:hypothetical protein KIW84_056990 [Lathyrus oleraceus]|uniref:ATP-dependent DNA helicase n=1 Tax=Pisum sativum TaxID=3888 RepID=A0A9D4X4N6_PEA|nr:hypothetical protein KIW84_056990 [Pisum sativum]